MYTTNLWYKLNLRSLQVAVGLLLLLFLVNGSLQAQQKKQTNKTIEQSRLNLIEYDDRLLTYGFTLGLHTSALRPKFSSAAFRIDDEGAPAISNIETPHAFGFSIGFLGNLRAAQYLDLRFMPRVSFYDYNIRYYNINEGEWQVPDRQAQFTTLDLPLSVKFKSARRGNYRMFFTAGATPMLNVSSKKKIEESSEFLSVEGNNLTADLGFGVDIYFPLFKFSPEVRYSQGIPNLKSGTEGKFDSNFDSFTSRVLALYLVFN